MASFADIPNSIKSVVEGFKNSEESRQKVVRIAIELDGGAPKDLVQALKNAFIPEDTTALLHIANLSKNYAVRVNPDCDFAIVVSGSEGLAVGAANAFARSGVACCIVVESSVEVKAEALEMGVTILCASDSAVLLAKLADWMVGANIAQVALASNFSFVRGAVVNKFIKDKSSQNGVVGVIPFGNGADMPIMAANQVLMAFDIANAHGHTQTNERLVDAGVVVASSFASRSLARSITGKIPGFDWAIRGLIGAGATFALGKGLSSVYAVQDAWKKRA